MLNTHYALPVNLIMLNANYKHILNCICSNQSLRLYLSQTVRVLTTIVIILTCSISHHIDGSILLITCQVDGNCPLQQRVHGGIYSYIAVYRAKHCMTLETCICLPALAKASCSALLFSLQLCFLRRLCQKSQRTFTAPNLSSFKEKPASTFVLAATSVSTFCNEKYTLVNHLRKHSTNMSRSLQACTLRCSSNKLLQATCTNTAVTVAIRDITNKIHSLALCSCGDHLRVLCFKNVPLHVAIVLQLLEPHVLELTLHRRTSLLEISRTACWG